MPRIDDVKESEAKKNYRLLRRTSRVTPGNNQSVTGGRTRFIGLQSLIVIGSQLVAGLLEVTGSIKILGLGILDVAGPATFSATLDVTAATRLRGKTTLEDDLNVKPGGKVIVEGEQQITLSSVGGTATLQFSDGPRVWSASSAGRMDAGAGTGIVLATTTSALLRSPDTQKAVAVSDLGTRITGDLISDLPLKAGAAVNVHVDSDGKFWRSS